MSVAVVTGAATGIGRAIAHRLAADGVHVVVNHRRSPEAADKVVDAISATGGSAGAYDADVSDEAAYSAMIESVLDEHGTWTVLVTTPLLRSPSLSRS